MDNHETTLAHLLRFPAHNQPNSYPLTAAESACLVELRKGLIDAEAELRRRIAILEGAMKLIIERTGMALPVHLTADGKELVSGARPAGEYIVSIQ